MTDPSEDDRTSSTPPTRPSSPPNTDGLGCIVPLIILCVLAAILFAIRAYEEYSPTVELPWTTDAR